MSGEGMIAADREELIQCFRCPAQGVVVAGVALPDGWDALRVPGYVPAYFCDCCVGSGSMEYYRAQQGIPRRQQWRFASGIDAFYQPVTRKVLLATPEGMAEISEQDAQALYAAIGAALAIRDHAYHLTAEVRS